MEKADRTYLPAAGHDWFLPLYDPLVKLLGGDRARRALVDQAALRPGLRVLEIGCGTGTLALMIKRLHPDVEVVGLDPDPKALARASRKAERSDAAIRFELGFADELPDTGASFDRVFSSLMFHHLKADLKEKTLREVRRVLRPGGSLHLLDFGGPKAGAHGFLARLLHSRHRLKDNFEGGILTSMRRVGFQNAREVSQGALLFAQTVYYQASVPASTAGAA